MPFGLQPIHLVVIFIVALLIFGPRRLPEIGRGIGKAINEFRKGTQEMTDSLREEISKPNQEAHGGAPVGTMAAANTMAPPAHSPADFSSSASFGSAADFGSAPTAAPVAAPTAMGNFCTQCGNPNPAEARFCNKCGSPLPA